MKKQRLALRDRLQRGSRSGKTGLNLCGLLLRVNRDPSLEKLSLPLRSRRRIASQVGADLQLPPRAVGAHVADRPENRADGSPGPIVAAKTPEDAAVGVGVPPVQGVLVVQLDQDL